ncbi:LOG family protein [Aspergillus novofumigatus IBT 16806]|uniref:Putative lysine decarboxylase n=1 Tax=Aspergillus novofumigatus (strain IBT 16806) TaxID=1392255 RepID=A0A2I1BX24_ASPN1|nr:putative lysine decarboxylase [Aspergillus novofumigatus IBT 16806]PKX89945.1 putative lysine decarboxylase [Aspergillus novofumigatus IBT 16806]
MAQQERRTVVCVFCGSLADKSGHHLEAARVLAHEFHKNNVQLVYGGGTVGIMGELARTLVSLSGPQAVHGIIPKALVEVEEGYKDIDRQRGTTKDSSPNRLGKAAERVVSHSIEESDYGLVTIVPDMHTRKRLMAQRVLEGGPGSGFVALAGGSLGIHKAGVVLLNINGYWDGILQWVRASVAEGLVSPENAGILTQATKVEDVLKMLREYRISNDRLKLDWGQE